MDENERAVGAVTVYDGLDYTYPVSDGPCAECGAAAPCMEFEGRMLCYDDWHGAREKTQCYKVQRVFQEGWPEICRGYVLDGCYTKEEAEARVLKVRARERDVEWVVVPWPHWEGSRMAHPGYLVKREEALRAELEQLGTPGALATLRWLDEARARRGART